MSWTRFRTFVGRRFAPDEYLGLHLTVGLLVSLVMLVLFLAVAHLIHQDRGGLYQFDLAVAGDMEEHANDHPAPLHFFRAVTQAGSIAAICVLTLAGAMVALVRRHRRLATVWLVAAVGCGLLNMTLKWFIDRHRPLNPDSSVHAVNNSYPSGHSMGSVIGYGMLAYSLFLGLRRRWARGAVIGLLAVLVLLIGFSRIYLRAHYVTDVLGGFCIGAVWLAVCVSGAEVLRRRPRHRAHELHGEPPGHAHDVPGQPLERHSRSS